MVGERKQFTLGDLCSLITDGKHGDCQDDPNSGFYFLSVKDVRNNRLVYESARQIKKEDFLETHRRTNLEPGDVLFTNTGTIGRMAIAPSDPRTLRSTFQKSVAILKPRRDLIGPSFLYYLLRFDNARLSALAAGTTQKNLLLKDLRSFPVEVPGLPEQRAIAHILGTLDDKIELNRRINETLEAMARALFKSWFVDFDPVRAKAEGRDPGLSKHIADLFPNSFEDSELGEIPKGWRLSSLGEEVDTLLGGTPSRSEPAYWGGDIPWINSGKANEFRIVEPSEYITQAGLESSATKLLPVRTTVIAITGATLGQVSITEIATCANQSIVGVLGSASLPSEYLYFWIKENIHRLIASQTGGAQQHINKNNVNELPIGCPPERVMRAFAATALPVFERIQESCFESRTLVALRDALLPKLITGEVRVADTAAAVGAKI